MKLTKVCNVPLMAYVHVPFCASRCGYCDFNTYTADELSPAMNPDSWQGAVQTEIALSGKVLVDPPPLDTIFFGGGTPSLVGAEKLVSIVNSLRETFSLQPDCEITTEVNPESSSLEFFEQLAEGGFTRISLGMQSSAPHVLAVLERKHNPEDAIKAVWNAHNAGFKHISLDLIYGTPGESNQDVRDSLTEAVATPIDHLSAYSLIVEEGTAMARKVKQGRMPIPDNDAMAEKYLIIDQLCSAQGMDNYEISNWAKPGGECRHNEGYWQHHHWWGYGPGAHSYIENRRWWNHKHPGTYNGSLARGLSPIAGSEDLTEADYAMERIMLQLRTRHGLPATIINGFDARQKSVMDEYISRGHVIVTASGAVQLTLSGRLIADAIIRDIV